MKPLKRERSFGSLMALSESPTSSRAPARREKAIRERETGGWHRREGEDDQKGREGRKARRRCIENYVDQSRSEIRERREGEIKRRHERGGGESQTELWCTKNRKGERGRLMN